MNDDDEKKEGERKKRGEKRGYSYPRECYGWLKEV